MFDECAKVLVCNVMPELQTYLDVCVSTGVFRTQSKICDGVFSQKSSTVDIQLDSKYTLERLINVL